MQYQICPVCHTKVSIENGKKLNICPNHSCPNPYLFSSGQIAEETEGTKDSFCSCKLYLKHMETGKLYTFSCPVILNRNSFSPVDFAISEDSHAFIDFTEEIYEITDVSTYGATWINSKRLNDGVSKLLSPGDTLRVGDTYLEVLYEKEYT